MKIISFIFIISSIFCLFDEELEMMKPIKGSSLFFRRYDQNNFYISNSLTNYIFNIRSGKKGQFTGIIPLGSNIYEPFILSVNNTPSFMIDGNTINDYIKIYNFKENIYKEYTGYKIKDSYKRKYCKFEIASDDRFVVGIQDSNNNFEIRLINSNGTEIFRSQSLNIDGSDDFYIYTNINKDNKAIIALIFYESKFVIHQWSRVKTGDIIYTTEIANSNQFVKQNNVQMSKGNIFCGQENGDVNCHIIGFKFQGGFSTKTFNVQMLQNCKSDFKLNILNDERYVVSCLNEENQFIIQLFSAKLQRDFDMDGMILFKDEITDNYTYDIINGKNNELVVLRADLLKNKYYIETFNFIKNSANIYVLCPTGCQDCYWSNQFLIKYGKQYMGGQVTLNCTLCKFNSYFSDNYADLCFLKKERPKG